MKLYVDTQGKQVTVSKDVEPKTDQNGNQRSEKGTGRLMWSTQVFVLDETGGEVITITTAGEKPNVTVGQLVTVTVWRPSRGRPTGVTAWRSARLGWCRRLRRARSPSYIVLCQPYRCPWLTAPAGRMPRCREI